MEENKWARLEMALSFVDPADPTKLQDMRHRLHLDKKCFLFTRKKERYLLLPGEKEPTHCVQHKLYIMKVMFLCAVTRPHMCKLLVGWQVGNLAYRQVGTGETKASQQA